MNEIVEKVVIKLQGTHPNLEEIKSCVNETIRFSRKEVSKEEKYQILITCLQKIEHWTIK